MKSNQSSPVWPYLGILVCLFALAVTAPRGWQPFAHREPIGQFLKQRVQRETTRQKLAARQWTAPPAIAVDERSAASNFASIAVPDGAGATSVVDDERSAGGSQSVADNDNLEQYALRPIVMNPRPPLAQQAEEPPLETAEPLTSAETADAALDGEYAAQDEPPPAEPTARVWPGEESEPLGALAAQLPEAEADETPNEASESPAPSIPRPEKLLADLASAESEPRLAEWAASVRALLNELCAADLPSRRG